MPCHARSLDVDNEEIVYRTDDKREAGGLVVQGAVTTVVVVVGEIGAEGPGRPAGAAVGGGVGPFREQGPDEAFRLAIGMG